MLDHCNNNKISKFVPEKNRSRDHLNYKYIDYIDFAIIQQHA